MVELFCPRCGRTDSTKPRYAPMRQDFEIETIIADCLLGGQLTSSGYVVNPYPLSLELYDCNKCGLIFAIGENITRDSKISTVDKFITQGSPKN